jgi:hypothetical protein
MASMRKLFIRLFYGILFALPVMLVSYALASANSEAAASAQALNAPAQLALAQNAPARLAPASNVSASRNLAAKMSCPACHEEFMESWETSAHGRSTTDPTFTKSWEAQGQPSQCLTCHTTGYDPDTNTWKADGITCQACHDTDAADHPMQPMAADRSSKMCGTCHTETYFEWQASAHRKQGIDCIACHDPHSTTLKAKDAAGQCATCHRDRSANFAASQHSKQGMDCADCHLAQLPDPTEGHARRDHSFTVRLTTCNTCHAYQMHDPSQVHPENPEPQPPDALAAVEKAPVADKPEPVPPLGFATLSGVFGLAAGAILAPWLEKLNRKRKTRVEGQEEESTNGQDKHETP